jgi:hypothetical protein
MNLAPGEDEGGNGGLEEVKAGYHDGERHSVFANTKRNGVSPLLPLKQVAGLA